MNNFNTRLRSSLFRLFTRSKSHYQPETSVVSRANPQGRKIDSQKGVLEFIDVGTSAGATNTGRAWRTSELRLKSYDDLHKLWFILLKERNVLLTERAWCKTNGRHWTNGPSNLMKVKQSMARIRGVVGERIRAHKARKLINTMKAEIEAAGVADAGKEPTTDPPGVISRNDPTA